MATNINAGTRNNHEQAHIVTITVSATDYVVFAIVPGSFKYTEGGIDFHADMERDQFTDVVRPGNENLSEISFDVYSTGAIHDTAQLLKLLEATVTAGVIANKFVLAYSMSDYRGGPGKLLTWNNCFCQKKDLPFSTSGSGKDPDKFTIKIQSTDHEATKTDYT